MKNPFRTVHIYLAAFALVGAGCFGTREPQAVAPPVRPVPVQTSPAQPVASEDPDLDVLVETYPEDDDTAVMDELDRLTASEDAERSSVEDGFDAEGATDTEALK